jgi:hypothetical protein
MAGIECTINPLISSMWSERHRNHAVAAAVWACVAGLIAIYLVLFVLCAAGRLARPLEEFTYGESWLLDGARQVASGEGLYAAPDHLPLMQFAYTPLYYVLVGALLRVFGDSGYTLGRLVSLSATLLGALALVWSVRGLTGRWILGLLAAGLFLTQNLTVLLWSSQHRVDPLALGLTLLGLAFFTEGRYRSAAVLFVLAFFTKQSFVVAPLAAAFALWPCRRDLVQFSAIVGVGVVGGVAIAQWLTDGWFWWHVVTTNANPADLITFATLMGGFLQFNGLPVLAALLSLILPAGPGERVWRTYFVGCLLTLPTLAKLGASSNYWLELTAATSVLLALATYRLSMWPALRVVAPTVLAGALLIALPGYQATAVEAVVVGFDALRPSSPRYMSFVGDSGGAASYRVEADFVDYVARQPGELLTDNSGLAVAAGKQVSYEFQIFQLLGAEGHWSEQPILDAVAAHRFSLVALMHPLDGPVDGTRWSAALQTALESAYQPSGTAAGFWLYTPRP